MKNLKHSIFTLFLLTGTIISAQTPSLISLQTDIVNSSYSVNIPEATVEEARKDWREYNDKYSKGKVKEDNGNYLHENTSIKTIAGTPITYNASFTDSNGNIQLNSRVIGTVEAGGAVDIAMQKYLRDYAVYAYKNHVKRVIDSERKSLHVLENKYSDIEHEKRNALHQIKKNKKQNEKAADEIASKEIVLDTVSKKVDEHQAMVEQTKADQNAHDGAKETQKELEERQAKLIRQNEKEREKIEDRKKENNEKEDLIENASSDSKVLSDQIKSKKEKIKQLEEKLAAIR